MSPAHGRMDLERRQLSHYRLIEKLGAGGMGAVYRAEDVRLRRQVALKLLPQRAAADARARAKFLQEAQAASAIDHPHICVLYEFGEADGQPFIAMQLVEGENLALALEHGPLPEARAREVLRAVASALSAAHRAGIIHRDVKSDNVLLGTDGSIKLSDFGIARLSRGVGSSSSQSLVGTPAYVAPEQLRGARASEASDQFSLGVVAYECLTGVRPFPGDSVAAVIHAILNLEPVPPSRLRPEISRGWDAALAQALAKDPGTRFASVEEFAAAMEAAAPFSGPPQGIERRRATKASSRAVAVLPFKNLSGDSESDYFCLGIAQDLLTDLSHIPGLRVASHNAVARYRGRDPVLAELKRDLGVEAVLVGSVRRAGSQVRITAELIGTRDGFQIWAERYDRSLEAVLAVQEDIARSIAAALRGALRPDEAAGIGRARPAEVTAYDLYLKGRDLYGRYTHADNLRALECFQQAVVVDSNYALAWTGIADACIQMHDKGWDGDPVWLERGLAAAERAVSLAPGLPDTHKAMGSVWAQRGDYERSIESLRRSIAVDPQFVPGLVNLGAALRGAGDLAGAERSIRRALMLDPIEPFIPWALAVVLMPTRRYDEVVALCERFQSLGPSPYFQLRARLWRICALGYQGALDDATRELEAARALGLERFAFGATEALVAAMAGDERRARERVHEIELEVGHNLPFFWVLAEAAGWIGDARAAVRVLRLAERSLALDFVFYRVLPGLARIRDSSEFREWIGERGRRLVWPAEAPALSPADRAQFTRCELASGLPESDSEF